MTVWVLLALAVVSVVFHLARLDYPREVVFDEVHFGKFVTAYCCTGQRFFDIHPPHVKLLIAGAGKLAGYDGGFDFDHIGEQYRHVPITAFRLVPALAGAALPVIIFLLLLQLGVSRPIAVLGGLAVLFDNAQLIQSRVITLDSMLLGATFGAMSAFLAAERSRNWRQIGWLVLTGSLAGLAVGAKFTGLTVLALLGIMVIVRLLRSRSGKERWQWFSHGVLIVACALAVYVLGWAVHYVLLPLPGPGDAFHVSRLTQTDGSPALVRFGRELKEIHQVMVTVNYNLDATHQDASQWWSWPFMRTPVYYWNGSRGLEAGERADMYFLGNPVVWWGSSLLLLVAILDAARRWVGRQKVPAFFWMLLLGYILAYLPFVRIPRALFLYHYLMPLLFALLAGLLWLDDYSTSRRSLVRRVNSKQLWPQPGWYVAVVIVLIVGFVFFSPLTFGFPIPSAWHTALFWFPTWR